ncbi:MAG: sigma-54-dependent transcriptional regulator [Pyrinomonadaceae bacterium]
MKTKILVVEDDRRLRAVLIETLSLEGHEVTGADTAEAAIELFEKESFDVLLTDVNLPGKSGIDLLPICLQHHPNTYLIVMTGYASIDMAVQAMKLGALDFLCKPISLQDLSSAVRVASTRIHSPLPVVPSEKGSTNSPIIASSVVMLNLLEQVKVIAPYKINVLITGETGTGKELIAREIHQSSPRSKKNFIAMNCAAIPEQLLEDELFGHMKGAFTGAQAERKGRFEQADGGTLFMDEIGNMNIALQAKMLRILQESEFERLGSSKTIKVDVRVISATSADLEARIADGSFRADLYHRLNVVHLRVPALRERSDDILPLAEGLLKRFCCSSGLPEKTLADEAYHSLISYNFPGNVRQLQNAMERAAVFSGNEAEVRLAHLPEEFRNQGSMFQIGTSASLLPSAIPDEGIDFNEVVSQIERKLLLQTLDKTGGNKMQAAILLNMKRTTLVEKIKRLNIDAGDDGLANEANE